MTPPSGVRPIRFDGPSGPPGPLLPPPADPEPAPAPVPPPGPSLLGRASAWLRSPGSHTSLTLALALLVAWHYRAVPGVVLGRLAAPFGASSPALRAGHAWRSELCTAAAAGFTAAATKLDQGAKVADADAELKAVFQATRAASFARTGAPAFDVLVPEGQEPTDPATRKAFAQAHRDFAAGLVQTSFWRR